MKLTLPLLMSLLVLLPPQSSRAAAEPELNPHLLPLKPWLGKIWKGHLKNSTPEKPVVDVAHWTRALNGKAVRIVHSVNEGAYGGESFLRWDEERQSVVYHYFTTAGFMTTGTMTFKGGKIHTLEKVTGNAGKVTEVRGITEMKGDGSFVVKTEHLVAGKWEPGRETIYREDATAQVRFR